MFPITPAPRFAFPFRQRKIGFRCPRGWTRLTEDAPCPGSVNKSHPIPLGKGKKKKKEPARPEEPVKKFGPEAKAARAEAARAAALEQAQKQAAAATQKAKEAEARAKQAELKLAANKLEMEREEQKRQKAWAEREKKLIAARNVGGQGSGRSERDRDRDRDRDPTAANGGRFADTGDGSSRGVARSDERARRLRSGIRRPPAGSPAALRSGTTWTRRGRRSYQNGCARAAGRTCPNRVRGPYGAGAPYATRRPREPRSRRRSTPGAALGSPAAWGSGGGSPAGSISPAVSGNGSPSGPGAAFPPGVSLVGADHALRSMQVWMQRCRLGCPPDVRPLLDDLIKKQVKSLIDSVGGVHARVDWANQDTTFAERCVRRAEQERESLRALETRGGLRSGGRSARANGAGDASASAFSGAFSSLVDVTPSVLFQPPAFFASRVERHIRDLIRETEARKETNVARFLANVALGEDGVKKTQTGAGANATNAKPSRSEARRDTAYLCASSVLRRAPEAAVNFLRSNGHEEWACRLHVLLWGSPFPDAGETFEDFERSDVIESRYKSDAAMAWLTENAYTRMGFTREDADAFELEGIARRASGVDVEAASLRDAYMLGLPRNLLETTVARAGGDVFRGVADALERAGAS